MTDIKRIETKAELRALAAELGVRKDWHEPDEREVTAECRGTAFDNAGFWGEEAERERDERGYSPEFVEQYVVLKREGESVAIVNLATLFALAAGRDD
jgi:hypothetical protein